MEAGPVIFEGHRGRGYGFEAVRLALEKAKNYGCKTVVAHIRKDNIQSFGLHKKLGFTLRREYVNSKGNEMMELAKNL
ncbi:MAG: GNAT family N-acetyltransferase [Oscillospiraceae bacterium]